MWVLFSSVPLRCSWHNCGWDMKVSIRVVLTPAKRRLGGPPWIVHFLTRASQKSFYYPVHCTACLLCSLLERTDCICKPGFSLCVWLSPPRAVFTKMLTSMMILSAMLSTQQLLLFPVPKRKLIWALRTCQQCLQAMNLWQKKAGVWCLLLHRLPAPWKGLGSGDNVDMEVCLPVGAGEGGVVCF